MYSILFVEGDTYYTEFYKDGMEFKPTPLKMDKKEYEKWKVGKVEV